MKEVYLNRSWHIWANDGRSLWGSKSSSGKMTKSPEAILSTVDLVSTILPWLIAAILSSVGIVAACLTLTSVGQNNVKLCPEERRRLPSIRLVGFVGNMFTICMSENEIAMNFI